MEELVIKEAINIARSVTKWIAANRKHDDIAVDTEKSEQCIEQHLTFAENWSRQISLRDLPRSRSLDDVFINLSLTENPLPGEKGQISSDHLLRTGIHSILLGHPGAGKTTVIKHLCQKLVHEPPGEGENFSFPVLVLLRDLREEQSLIDHILDLLGIRVAFKYEEDELEIKQKKKDLTREEEEELARKMNDRKQRENREKETVLIQYLNRVNALLLLDGLDELRPEHGLRIRSSILRLANLLTSSKFVLTCRIGALEVAIDNAEVLYLCSLDDAQINEFASKWLGSDERADAFLTAVRRSPYRDTVGRPLVLVNLCLVYQNYGELPEPHTLIYQKVVQLLLEQWDRERDLHLRRTSRYGRFFGPERKRQFLGALSYRLAKSRLTGPRYRDSDLRAAYDSIAPAFGLPFEEKEQVLSEIESHTGIFLRVGFSAFEFSHKSLQEFLCADHISRLADLKPELATLSQLPNECAIATVLSSSPVIFLELLAVYFASPAGRNFIGTSVVSFWNPYLTRLRIEGAGFVEDERLGFSLLFVASLAWQKLAKDGYSLVEGGNTLLALLDDLLSQAVVEKSVFHARSNFFVREVGNGYAEFHIDALRRTLKPGWMPEVIALPPRFIAK